MTVQRFCKPNQLCMFVFLTHCFPFIPMCADASTLHVPKDHQTIQKAIETANQGDVVLVSPGTYYERLRMKAGVIVRSVGGQEQGEVGLLRAEKTIIDGSRVVSEQAEGLSDQPGVLMAEGATLDGFTVTGVGLYDEQSWQHHHETRGEEQTYDKIGKPGVAGITVVGIQHCSVLNNIVHHIGYTGIVVMGSEGVIVAPRIANNVTFRNMGGGIGAMMKSSPVIDSNICFENFYAGIGHASGAEPTVINNQCYRNIRAGIGISEGSKPLVRGNRCYENRRAGIGVRTGSDTIPIIENNDCFDNGMAGIGVSDHASAVIRSNRCYRNLEAGIGCREGATPEIISNECYENGMSGIGSRLQASPVIRDNKCHHNQTAGIGSQDGSTATLIGNECYENEAAGIGIEDHSEVTARDNQCYRNRQAGIGVRLEASAVIQGNHCFENDLAGIGVEDAADAVITDNTCEKNLAAGIGVRGGATATLYRNRCKENAKVAIGVDAGSSAKIFDNYLMRTGGMPPMIAIKGGSQALIVANQIVGGGVAGVLVQGHAKILNNQFSGNGPRGGGPPNFGVWVHEDSSVSVVSNQFKDWRHAVSASKAKQATVIDNQVEGFLKAAIVIQGTKQGCQVYSNVAISGDAAAQCVRVGEDEQTSLADNVLRKPDPSSGAESSLK